MALIGASFQPGNTEDQNNPQFRDSVGPNGAVGPNIGQAIQILRIRMPHVFGMAPSPLLAGGPLSGFGRTIQNLLNMGGFRPNTIPQGGTFDPSGAPFRPAPGSQPSPGFQYGAPPQTAPPSYAPPTPQVVEPPPSPRPAPMERPAPLPGFRPGRGI